MSNIKKDLYQLGQSTAQALTTVGQEIRIDLNLVNNKLINGGTITGTVTDENAAPISGAVIKIMDNDYTPLAHAITNSQGTYLFSPFKAGTNYRIFCSAPGFALATLDQFSLLDEQSLNKDFSLVKDPSLTKSLIAGDVFDVNNKPIEGAIVNLFSLDEKLAETLVAMVFTNKYGQYAFRELENNNYKIEIGALGFLSLSTIAKISAPSTIINLVNNLVVDSNSSKGTISGIITDDNNQPIIGADVILYQVAEDNSLTPVALTKTIANGVYLFVNTTQGKYTIKSSKSVDTQN